MTSQKKTESSNNDTNCLEKHWVTHELQRTDMSSQTKMLVLTTQKRGIV